MKSYSLEKCCLHIFGVGMFRVTNGKLIEYMKTVDIEEYQLEQWILNRCIPLAMLQQGKIILHGSALLYNKEMVIISGESGSGKSTLSNSLMKDGLDFAADDTIYVNAKEEKVEGIGAYPLRRLCSDIVSYEEKQKLIHIPDGDKDKYGCDMKNIWPESFSIIKYMFIISPEDIKNVEILR